MSLFDKMKRSVGASDASPPDGEKKAPFKMKTRDKIIVGVIAALVVVFIGVCAGGLAQSLNKGMPQTIEDLGSDGSSYSSSSGISVNEFIDNGQGINGKSYESDAYTGASSDATTSSGSAADDGGSDMVSTENDDTKRVYSGSESLETTDFDAAYDRIYDAVEAHGGYIIYDRTWYQDSYTSSDSYRFTSLTVRLPYDDFTDLVHDIEGIEGVSVLSKNVSLTDVTDAYSSLEDLLSTERSKLDSLREIASEATTIDEKLSMLDRVTEQEKLVADIEYRIANYDVDTTYSTLDIRLQERGALSVQGEGFDSKLTAAFEQGWENGVAFFGGIILFVVGNWVMLAVVAGVVFLAYRRYRKQRADAVAQQAEAAAEPPSDDGTRGVSAGDGAVRDDGGE